jgi:pilin isopeptide linkage protein
MKCCTGTIEFPEICYTEPGKHTYTIREISQPNPCWLTDKREYRVVVTVSESNNGCLSAVVEYLDGHPKFVNRYCPPKCCCC